MTYIKTFLLSMLSCPAEVWLLQGAFFFYGAVAMDAPLFCKELGLGSTPTRSTSKGPYRTWGIPNRR